MNVVVTESIEHPTCRFEACGMYALYPALPIAAPSRRDSLNPSRMRAGFGWAACAHSSGTVDDRPRKNGNPRRRPSTLSRSLAYAFAMSTIVARDQRKGALGSISSERVANPKAPLGGKLVNDAALRCDLSPAKQEGLLNTSQSSPSAS
jgi:hypothetical protein